MKEAYSLIIGEAMAKGIMALTHCFYGAERIWDELYIWNTIDEVCNKMLGAYESLKYYDYIKDKHNLKKVLKKWDTLLNE